MSVPKNWLHSARDLMRRRRPIIQYKLDIVTYIGYYGSHKSIRGESKLNQSGSFFNNSFGVMWHTSAQISSRYTKSTSALSIAAFEIII